MRQSMPEDEPVRTNEEQKRINNMIARYQRKKRKRRVVLGVILFLILSSFILYKSCVRPPRIDTDIQAGPYVSRRDGEYGSR